jgi:hypothetical protein
MKIGRTTARYVRAVALGAIATCALGAAAHAADPSMDPYAADAGAPEASGADAQPSAVITAEEHSTGCAVQCAVTGERASSGAAELLSVGTVLLWSLRRRHARNARARTKSGVAGGEARGDEGVHQGRRVRWADAG